MCESLPHFTWQHRSEAKATSLLLGCVGAGIWAAVGDVGVHDGEGRGCRGGRVGQPWWSAILAVGALNWSVGRRHSSRSRDSSYFLSYFLIISFLAPSIYHMFIAWYRGFTAWAQSVGSWLSWWWTVESQRHKHIDITILAAGGQSHQGQTKEWNSTLVYSTEHEPCSILPFQSDQFHLLY